MYSLIGNSVRNILVGPLFNVRTEFYVRTKNNQNTVVCVFYCAPFGIRLKLRVKSTCTLRAF